MNIQHIATYWWTFWTDTLVISSRFMDLETLTSRKFVLFCCLFFILKKGKSDKQLHVYVTLPLSPLIFIITVFLLIITKTYLSDFDPLKPHFYTVKLGFTGVYIIFLISAQKHRLVLVRTASFWAEIWKLSAFLSENFQFFGGEIFCIFE